MSVDVGTRLGSLEITALLGKGGMGEVYRARDTKLKRDVAIKILPDEFARDADRVNRFQREAETLASLSPPSSPTGILPNPKCPVGVRPGLLADLCYRIAPIGILHVEQRTDLKQVGSAGSE